MKFVAVDLKTTGLLTAEHQILEIGIVIGDWESPMLELPVWNGLIARQKIIGHPAWLVRHAEVIELIEAPGRVPGLAAFGSMQLAIADLSSWLRTQLSFETVAGKLIFPLAARNELTRSFLLSEPTWTDRFNIRGETLTPGGLYYRRGETRVPDLDECYLRAGLEKDYGDRRRAVNGAYRVVQLLRRFHDVREGGIGIGVE